MSKALTRMVRSFFISAIASRMGAGYRSSDFTAPRGSGGRERQGMIRFLFGLQG
jgi:hypothetical protein